MTNPKCKRSLLQISFQLGIFILIALLLTNCGGGGRAPVNQQQPISGGSGGSSSQQGYRIEGKLNFLTPAGRIVLDSSNPDISNKTVELKKINNNGTLDSVKSVKGNNLKTKTNSLGQFEISDIPPAEKANLVLICTDCKIPISKYVKEVINTAKDSKNDVGTIDEETTIEKEIISKALQEVNRNITNITQQTKPEEINLGDVKAIINPLSAMSLIENNQIKSGDIEKIAQSIIDMAKIEKSVIRAMGENVDSIGARIREKKEKCADKKDITNYSNYQNCIKEEIRKEYGEDFLLTYLETCSHSLNILTEKGNIVNLTILSEAKQEEIVVEKEKISKRIDNEVERILGIIDRLVEIAKQVPSIGDINKSSIISEINKYSTDIKAKLSTITTKEEAIELFKEFHKNLDFEFKQIISFIGIQEQTIKYIIEDIRTKSSGCEIKDSISIDKAMELIKASQENALTGISYILADKFTETVSTKPDKIKEIAKIIFELIQIIYLEKCPLQPPIVEPIKPEIPINVGINKLIIIPESATLKLGEIKKFEAWGIDGNGNKVPVKPFWYVAPAYRNGENVVKCGPETKHADENLKCLMPSIGYIEEDGTFVSKYPGEGFIVASLEVKEAEKTEITYLEATAKIKVESDLPPQKFEKIIIKPSQAQVALGKTLQFTAYGITHDGQEEKVQPYWAVIPATWDEERKEITGCYTEKMELLGANTNQNTNIGCLIPPIGYIDEEGIFKAISIGFGIIKAYLDIPLGDILPAFITLEAEALVEVFREGPEISEMKIKIKDSKEFITELETAVGEIIDFDAYGKVVGKENEWILITPEPAWVVEPSDWDINKIRTETFNSFCGGIDKVVNYNLTITDQELKSFCMPPIIPPLKIGYIDENGIFYASAPGEGKISAILFMPNLTDCGGSATDCGSKYVALKSEVKTIVKAIKAIKIEPEKPTLKAGEILKFKVMGILENGNNIILNNIAWHLIPVDSISLGPEKTIYKVNKECSNASRKAVRSASEMGIIPENIPECTPVGKIQQDGTFYALRKGNVLAVATLWLGYEPFMLQDVTLITVEGEAISGPDLSIKKDSISWMPEFPKDGEKVTIKAKILNLGDKNAENITVKITDNSDGMLDVIKEIDKINIPLIESKGSYDISTVWDTKGQQGPNMLSIELKSDKEDLNSCDNVFTFNIWVDPEIIKCSEDVDCAELICPPITPEQIVVIINDTPKCNKEKGICYCGPSEEQCQEYIECPDGTKKKYCSIEEGKCICPLIPPKVLCEEMTIDCKTNEDCSSLICPAVVGKDTPTCDTTIGKCYCGQKNDIECPETYTCPDGSIVPWCKKTICVEEPCSPCQCIKSPETQCKVPENECNDDSDCITGGCSGEICQSKNTEPIASICIYKEWFKCLDLTSCGCFEGKCGWKKNNDFLMCMEKYKK